MYESALYAALGQAVVTFERLMSGLKHRLAFWYGFAPEVFILLEAYSAQQTVERLSDIVDLAESRGVLDGSDVLLYKALTSDLRTLNTTRNRLVHSTWAISVTGGSETTKQVMLRGITPAKHTVSDLSPAPFEALVGRAEVLHRVLWTAGTMDVLRTRERHAPRLSQSWQRTPSGDWLDLRERSIGSTRDGADSA